MNFILKIFLIIALMTTASCTQDIGRGQATPWPAIPDDINNLLPVSINGKCGFITIHGKIKIPPAFDGCGIFSEDRGYIKTGRNIGFVDTAGNIVVSPRQYDEIHGFFKQGLIGVKMNGKYGFMDKTGKIAIQPQFQIALPFSEGLAAVKIGNKYGFIDGKGRLVIPPVYESASVFREGLCRVQRKGKQLSRDGFIDMKGNMVIDLQEGDYIASDFHDGLAAVRSFVSKGTRYLDKKGRTILNTPYQNGWRFDEGLAPVQHNGKYGFIDKTGKVIIDFLYDDAGPFSGGPAPVKVDGKWGYIDKTGKTIPNVQFDWASNFHQGVADIRIGDNEGYIDRTGNYVWQPSK